MEFRRKKKHGQNQKVRRAWFSEEGHRIVWRKEAYGVRVPARFQACVRTLVPYSDGTLPQMWDFANRGRRLIKTLQAAQDECEKHKRLWTKACQATGIRALKELFGGKLPMGLPVWVRKKIDRRLYGILTDNRPGRCREDDEEEPCTESLSPASGGPGPSDPTRTSDCSASPKEATSESGIPASPAEGKERSTTPRTRRARSKDTTTSDASVVSSAKGTAKGRKQPVAKRTEKPSKRIAKRKTSTTGSSVSAKPRSRDSRKTKSLPSGS